MKTDAAYLTRLRQGTAAIGNVLSNNPKLESEIESRITTQRVQLHLQDIESLAKANPKRADELLPDRK